MKFNNDFFIISPNMGQFVFTPYMELIAVLDESANITYETTISKKAIIMS